MLPTIPDEKIILTEYGRNIQNMVQLAMQIEDKEERTKCVNTIIDTMGIFFPHLRDVNDFKHKLWDHLAMMSNYKLDIDYPYEVPQAPVQTIPEKVPYPAGKVRYRYYGNFIAQLVGAADKLEGEDRERYIGVLANHMKRNYLAWNKDNVEDKTILQDLYDLSEGKIDLLHSDFQLKSNEELALQKPSHQADKKKNAKKGNHNNKKKN